jgi:hypothetical protein
MPRLKFNYYYIVLILVVLSIAALEILSSRYISKSVVHDSQIGLNQIHKYGCLTYADIFCYDHRYGWVRRKNLEFEHQNEDYQISHRWNELEPYVPIVHVSDSKMGALEVNDEQSTVENLSRITGKKNGNLGHSGYSLLQYYIWVNDLLKSKNSSKIEQLVIHIDYYSDITLLDQDVWYCYSPFAWQLYPRYNPARDGGQELHDLFLPVSGARVTNYYYDRLKIPNELDKYRGSADLYNESNQFLLEKSNLYRLYLRGKTSNNPTQYKRCLDRNIRQGGSALHEIFDQKMDTPVYWDIANKIIGEFSDFEKKYNKKILLVIHPDPFSHHDYSQERFVGLPKFDHQKIEAGYSKLFEIIKTHNMDSLDLRRSFLKVKTRHNDVKYHNYVDQGLFFYKRDTSHMNPYGHAVTACAIAQKLGEFKGENEKIVCQEILDKNHINDFLQKSELDSIFNQNLKYRGGTILLNGRPS